MLKIALYTLFTAFFSTLISALIGIPTAFFTSKRRFFGRKLLLSFGAVPLCIPALIVALAYVSFWGVNGTANNLLKLIFAEKFQPLHFLYSTTGIIIAQGFYNFPLVTKILNDAWTQLPKAQENAARLLGTKESRIFFTITFPRLKGALAAACIPVFLYCFFSFMIVLLFSPPGHSTLEVEIYHAIRTTLNVKDGALMALLEMALALLVIIVYTVATRKSQVFSDGQLFQTQKAPRLCARPFQTKKQKLLEATAFSVLIILILLFFIFPAFGIVISSFSIRKANHIQFGLSLFKTIFKSKTFWKSLGYSVFTGFFTGFFCMLTGFIYSVFVKLSKKQGSTFFLVLPLFPMVISSVVLAWILGLIFHRGSIALLIFAQVLLNWPVAYRQLQNGINRITLETDRAALLLSKNRLDSIFRVYLPASKTYLKAAFGFCFAISLGDATLPLILSIPGFNTLALYTYRLAGSYKFNQACACGVILAVLSALVFRITEAKNSEKK